MAFNISSTLAFFIYYGFWVWVIMFKIMGKSTVKTAVDLVLLSVC